MKYGIQLLEQLSEATGRLFGPLIGTGRGEERDDNNRGHGFEIHDSCLFYWLTPTYRVTYCPRDCYGYIIRLIPAIKI